LVTGQGKSPGSAFEGSNNLTDWYLPSIDELALLCAQRTTVGGFLAVAYWSSTESAPLYARQQAFNLDFSIDYYKNYANEIRQVRAFSPRISSY
jgi:hypothetical protein